MTCLARNKSPFYVAHYSSKVAIVDSDGYETGEYTTTYSTPVKLMGNISPASGIVTPNYFGQDIQYDKVIVMDNINGNTINESDLLCIDNLPSNIANIVYDYEIKRIARSKKIVAIAISKIK